VYRGQQADGTAGTQTPMRDGHSYDPLNDIPPPPAEDTIDDIRAESDDDRATWRPNPTSFLKMKTGFQKFERNLQNRIISQRRYLEVIRNRALSLVADYEQSVIDVKDVALLREHNHNVHPPAAGSLGNWKRTGSRPAAN